MEHSQISAFFDEFPFLNRHWTPFDFSSVKVKRWNEKLLKSIGSVDLYYDIYPEEVSVLDEAGNLLLTNPPPFNPLKPSTWFRAGRALSGKGFPLTKALAGMGDQLPKVYWAVYILRDLKRPELVLYKPPADSSVAHWLTKGRYL